MLFLDCFYDFEYMYFMKIPAWGGQTITPNDMSLSLTEIQKLQEDKERQERLEVRVSL